MRVKRQVTTIQLYTSLTFAFFSKLSRMLVLLAWKRLAGTRPTSRVAAVQQYVRMQVVSCVVKMFCGPVAREVSGGVRQ